jgi:hypothetical protein
MALAKTKGDRKTSSNPADTLKTGWLNKFNPYFKVMSKVLVALKRITFCRIE